MNIHLSRENPYVGLLAQLTAHTMRTFYQSVAGKNRSGNGTLVQAPKYAMLHKIHSRVRRPIKTRCCGYCAIRSVRFAISKSAKSNPGATVHPTNEYDFQSETWDANQQPTGTTA